MDAPKDPDTRPGPPPSANVPLGTGTYFISASQHDFKGAGLQQLLFRIYFKLQSQQRMQTDGCYLTYG